MKTTDTASKIPLLRVKGAFFRVIAADRVEHVLSPPAADSAGRYHRPGQPVLYMSPEADWARIAVSGYHREDGIERVVVPLEIDAAHVFDQRNEAACAMLGIDREQSNVSWRKALERSAEPPSWKNADAARAIGADGIVDRSRHIPGGWHVNLFHWNRLGGPKVTVTGDPIAIAYRTDGPKWG